MDSKIQELTTKIYEEGVAKGEQKAKEIIADAQVKADKIIADAKAQADAAIVDAKKKAEELKRNTDSEVKLSGQQAIAAIKQKIIDAVIAKVVDEKAGATLSKPETIIELVKTLLTHWKPASHDMPSIEVILPADKQAALEQAFKHDAHALLTSGLALQFSKSIKGGFQIVQKQSGYKISMTDEDFAEFFKEFLRPKAKGFLFGE